MAGMREGTWEAHWGGKGTGNAGKLGGRGESPAPSGLVSGVPDLPVAPIAGPPQFGVRKHAASGKPPGDGVGGCLGVEENRVRGALDGERIQAPTL